MATPHPKRPAMCKPIHGAPKTAILGSPIRMGGTRLKSTGRPRKTMKASKLSHQTKMGSQPQPSFFSQACAQLQSHPKFGVQPQPSLGTSRTQFPGKTKWGSQPPLSTLIRTHHPGRVSHQRFPSQLQPSFSHDTFRFQPSPNWPNQSFGITSSGALLSTSYASDGIPFDDDDIWIPPLEDNSFEFPMLGNPSEWHHHIRSLGTVLETDISTATPISLLMYVDSLVHYNCFSRLLVEFDQIYARSRMVGRHARSLLRSRRGRRALKQLTVDELTNACSTSLRPTILGLLGKLGRIGHIVAARLTFLTQHEAVLAFPSLSAEAAASFLDSLPARRKRLYHLTANDEQLGYLFDFIVRERRKHGSRNPYITLKLIKKIVSYTFKHNREAFESFLYQLRPPDFSQLFHDDDSLKRFESHNSRTLGVNKYFRKMFFRLGLEYCLPVIKKAILRDVEFWNRCAPITDRKPWYIENFSDDLLEYIVGDSLESLLSDRHAECAIPFRAHPDDPAVIQLSLEEMKIFLQSHQETPHSLFPVGFYPTRQQFTELNLPTEVDIQFAHHHWSINPVEASFYSSTSLIYDSDIAKRSAAFSHIAMYILLSNNQNMMQRFLIVARARAKSAKPNYISTFSPLFHEMPLTRRRLEFLNDLVQLGFFSSESLISLLMSFSPGIEEDLLDETVEFAKKLLLRITIPRNFTEMCRRQTISSLPPISETMDSISWRFLTARYSSQSKVKAAENYLMKGNPLHVVGISEVWYRILNQFITSISENSSHLFSEGMLSLFLCFFQTNLIYKNLSNQLQLFSSLHKLPFAIFEVDGVTQADFVTTNFIKRLSSSDFNSFLQLVMVHDDLLFGNVNRKVLCEIFSLIYNSKPLILSTQPIETKCNRGREFDTTVIQKQAKHLRVALEFHNFELQTTVGKLSHTVKHFLFNARQGKILKRIPYRRVLSYLQHYVRTVLVHLQPKFDEHVAYVKDFNELQALRRLKRDLTMEESERKEKLSSKYSPPLRKIQWKTFSLNEAVNIFRLTLEVPPVLKETIIKLLYCSSTSYTDSSVAYQAASELYHSDPDIQEAIWSRFPEDGRQASLALNALLEVLKSSNQLQRERILRRAETIEKLPNLGLVVAKQIMRLQSEIRRQSSDSYEQKYQRYYDGLGIGLRSALVTEIFKHESKQYLENPVSFAESQLFELMIHAFKHFSNIYSILTTLSTFLKKLMSVDDNWNRASVIEAIFLALKDKSFPEPSKDIISHLFGTFNNTFKIYTRSVVDCFGIQMLCQPHVLTAEHFLDQTALDGFRQHFDNVKAALNDVHQSVTFGREPPSEAKSLVHNIQRSLDWGNLVALLALPGFDLDLALQFQLDKLSSAAPVISYLALKDSSDLSTRIIALQRFTLHPEPFFHRLRSEVRSFPFQTGYSEIFSLLQAFQAHSPPQFMQLLFSYFNLKDCNLGQQSDPDKEALFNYMRSFITM